MTSSDLITTLTGHLQAEQHVDAARILCSSTGIKAKIDSKVSSVAALWGLVQHCLDSDEYENASRLLWGHRVSFKPRCTQMVWSAIRSHTQILLLGGSSMSKTYAAGVFFFLDWLRDPEYTTVKVAGPSEQHLQDNLFSHLVELHRTATLPMPGMIGDLYIGLDLRQRRSSISGVVIPLGKTKSGKIQGVKKFPRRKPHPIFGPMSRLRVLLDELERIPQGVFQDLDNVLSNMSGEFPDGLKIVGAYNPTDPTLALGVRAEPPSGWNNFDIEKDEVWDSRRGWHVIRLDPHKCENVMEGKELFPGLQTREGLKALEVANGGQESPGYYTFGRGAYPAHGVFIGIIPPALLKRCKADPAFIDEPRLYAGVDLALEGGDSPVMAVGRFGTARSLWIPPGPHDIEHRLVTFEAPRKIFHIDRLLKLESGDTVAMAKLIKVFAREQMVPPEHIMLDRTGNGAGVHDLLKELWSPSILAINYSETASNVKIMNEDEHLPEDSMERVYSEIWVALKRWLEFQYLVFSINLDSLKLFEQLTTRQFSIQKERTKVESKRVYCGRGFKSPNEADAITLALHCVRVVSRYVPHMLVTKNTVIDEEEDFEPRHSRDVMPDFLEGGDPSAGDFSDDPGFD